MDKRIFNSLTIIEQINYFNEKLRQGFNITQICSDINISYNTVRDRFSKSFYSYNKITNRYECVEKLFPLDEEVIEKALERVVTKLFNSPQHYDFSNKLIIEPKQQDIPLWSPALSSVSAPWAAGWPSSFHTSVSAALLS